MRCKRGVSCKLINLRNILTFSLNLLFKDLHYNLLYDKCKLHYNSIEPGVSKVSRIGIRNMRTRENYPLE